MSSSVARVLVVDDSPGVLRIAEAALNEAGCAVTCLDHGAEATEAARRIRPQVILVSYSLGDTGGYDVCRRLGEDAELEGIPIVIMSSRADPVGDRFIRELGVVDHITKPFSPDALVAVVQHTLDKPSFRRRPFSLSVEAADPGRPTAAGRLAAEIADALGHDDDDDAASAQVQRILEARGSGPLIRDLFFERIDRPGLTGEMSVVPIAEVLQLLSMQRQSGFLRVTHRDTAVSIAFKDGDVRLVTGENLAEEFLLGNIVVQEGMLEPGELDVLLNNRKGTRQRLGTQMIKLGYLSKEQLHEALRRQSSELCYELLRWSTGRYTFTPQDELPAAVLEFEFDLTTDELLMEGFRRVDEWGLIESALPSFDEVLTPAPGGAAHTGPQGLTTEEQNALRAVDGRRTAREVIAELGLGTFVGARLLYRLVAARVVTVRPSKSGD